MVFRGATRTRSLTNALGSPHTHSPPPEPSATLPILGKNKVKGLQKQILGDDEEWSVVPPTPIESLPRFLGTLLGQGEKIPLWILFPPSGSSPGEQLHVGSGPRPDREVGEPKTEGEKVRRTDRQTERNQTSEKET